MVNRAPGAPAALAFSLSTKAPESSVEEKDLLSASVLGHHGGINVLEGSPAVAREHWGERSGVVSIYREPCRVLGVLYPISFNSDGNPVHILQMKWSMEKWKELGVWRQAGLLEPQTCHF